MASDHLFNFYVFFNDTATTEIYTYLHTLSLHDALPICPRPPSIARCGCARGVADRLRPRHESGRGPYVAVARQGRSRLRLADAAHGERAGLCAALAPGLILPVAQRWGGGSAKRRRRGGNVASRPLRQPLRGRHLPMPAAQGGSTI